MSNKPVIGNISHSSISQLGYVATVDKKIQIRSPAKILPASSLELDSAQVEFNSFVFRFTNISHNRIGNTRCRRKILRQQQIIGKLMIGLQGSGDTIV